MSSQHVNLSDARRLFVGLVASVIACSARGDQLRDEEVKPRPPLPQPVDQHADEIRALRALEKPVSLEFNDLALSDAVQYFSAFFTVPIRIDQAALKAANIPLDPPVTLKLDNFPFRPALDLVLDPLGLDAYVDSTGLVVTTRAASTDAVRRRLEKYLAYELQIVVHLCGLSASQVEKLQLAGRGDIRRLLDRVEACKAKVQRDRSDEKNTRELLREIFLNQRKIESGPFGNGSLFRKTLETVLTAEQAVNYEPIRFVIEARGLVATLVSGPDVLLGIGLIQADVTDEGMSHLRGLTELGILRLDATPVTDAGLAHLQKLTNMQSLGLDSTQIGDAGLVHLKEMTKLQKLDLAGTRVTDAGLKHLSGLINIQTLDLLSTKVSDSGLVHLHGLVNLQTLDLRRTMVTDAGVAALQMALPKTRIMK